MSEGEREGEREREQKNALFATHNPYLNRHTKIVAVFNFRYHELYPLFDLRGDIGDENHA